MINRVTLIGRIGQTPESKQSASGSKFMKFSIATSESHKNSLGEWETETQWHNIVVFGKTAEFFQGSKGDAVYVEGKIKYNEFTKDDGTKTKSTDIIAMTLKNLSPKQKIEPQNSNISMPSLEDDVPF